MTFQGKILVLRKRTDLEFVVDSVLGIRYFPVLYFSNHTSTSCSVKIVLLHAHQRDNACRAPLLIITNHL